MSTALSPGGGTTASSPSALTGGRSFDLFPILLRQPLLSIIALVALLNLVLALAPVFALALGIVAQLLQ